MTEARWLEAEEDRVWRGWLALTDRLHSQLASDLLADSGLSHADYQILVHLSEAQDRRVRMSDLAIRLDWSKSRVSHQVARMETRGLVRREECPSDARGALAVLTDAGMDQIRSAAPAHVESVRRHFIDLLEPRDLEVLGSIAARVLEHLRSQSACSEALAQGVDSLGCPPAGSGSGGPAAAGRDGPEAVGHGGGQAHEGHTGAED